MNRMQAWIYLIPFYPISRKENHCRFLLRVSLQSARPNVPVGAVCRSASSSSSMHNRHLEEGVVEEAQPEGRVALPQAEEAAVIARPHRRFRQHSSSRHSSMP